MSMAIYVGRNLTADGIAYLSGYGDEPSSHWLEVVPRVAHLSGAQMEVGVTPDATMPGRRSMIPQAGETARHLRVSYSHYRGVPAPLTNGGVNEHGVAVRDVWSPSCERLRNLTSADQSGPNYSDLSRLVLERAKSARGGVELIGELIAAYGESTYGGNSHLIADADEAWVVIEFAGGRGLWVAERLTSDDLRVLRPGYVLDVPLDFHAHADFMGAPHLIDFAMDRGWYQPATGPFNANVIYGDGLGRWAGAAWIEDELRRRANAHERITIADLRWALRTPRLTGDTAGYAQVVPLGPVCNPSLRVMWHAPASAMASPLTPFFLGIDEVPPEFGPHRYLTAGESARLMDDRGAGDLGSAIPQDIEATRSAVASAKRLLYLVAAHHEAFLPEVSTAWEAFEASADRDLADVMAAARALYAVNEPGTAERLLTRHARIEAVRSLDLVETLAASIEGRSRLQFELRRERGWRGPDQLW